MSRSSVRGGFDDVSLVRPGASSLRSHRPGLHKERPCGARARAWGAGRGSRARTRLLSGQAVWVGFRSEWDGGGLYRRRIIVMEAHTFRRSNSIHFVRAPQGRSLCCPGRCECSELAPGRTSETSSNPRPSSSLHPLNKTSAVRVRESTAARTVLMASKDKVAVAPSRRLDQTMREAENPPRTGEREPNESTANGRGTNDAIHSRFEELFGREQMLRSWRDRLSARAVSIGSC